jgi:hypothetical protein
MESECPVCRANLLWGSGVLGKLVCPLTPNRLADEILSEIFASLTAVLAEAFPDGVSSSIPSKSRDKGKGKQEKLQKSEFESGWDAKITGWRPGGPLKLEWEKRVR